MKVTNRLYKGKVLLNFNSFGHKYTVGDDTVTSVTTALSIIAKPALVAWSARMATEYIQGKIEPGESYDEVELNDIFGEASKAHYRKKKKAGEVGTLVHKWIEDYINNENPKMPVNQMLQDAINNFLFWVKEHDVKFLLAEQPVYSKKYMYAGLIDFICTIDGKLYVGDIKTSKGIYTEYMIQTSAYRNAREEEYPDEKYAGQVIVRVGKDGSFETAVIRDKKIYKDMLKTFVSALNLKKSMDSLKGYEPETK